jgi:DNA-binding winged helix-turn-helix (wHTH) protein
VFALLRVLTVHTGRIVTPNEIAKQVWPGQSSDPSEGLRVHINHLRKKTRRPGHPHRERTGHRLPPAGVTVAVGVKAKDMAFAFEIR